VHAVGRSHSGSFEWGGRLKWSQWNDASSRAGNHETITINVSKSVLFGTIIKLPTTESELIFRPHKIGLWAVRTYS